MNDLKHSPFMHEHPSRTLSLRTRTRWLGTVNVAIALRGRSCGWGSCGRPRRTFFGFNRRPKNDTGKHFVELVTLRSGVQDERVLFRIGDPREAVEYRKTETEGKS